jgi:4-aminobutyrate aminotransferase-like enzyme
MGAGRARGLGMSSSDQSQPVLRMLRDFESPNITWIEEDGAWPIVWERARGSYVWDVNGKKYLDLTSAFGVAAAGHANPRVVKAGKAQMSKLLHAMGDVHPHRLKAELARELSRITFERWNGRRGRTIFCSSGFEAVEAALKTARLATGRGEIIAFKGAYHGLGYGALNATYRQHFRGPFLTQLGSFGRFVEFPSEPRDLERLEQSLQRLLGGKSIGAVLAEPVQARAGIIVPPKGFLPMLRRLCDQHGALMILDEIYTGFGRTGKWFATEHENEIPDIICLGKALTGGFPLSACVGRAEMMAAAWPRSTGEAIHTSTFLGHPVGCAMALAQIREIETKGLVERSSLLGKILLAQLASMQPAEGLRGRVRGAGLLAGIELTLQDGRPATESVLRLMKRLLKEGCILLPEGEHANVLAFSPPLTITKTQLTRAASVLDRLLQDAEMSNVQANARRH